MQDNLPDRLERSLAHLITRAFRMVNRASSRALEQAGVSGEQGHVLLVLWAYGPMPVGKLQRMLALSSPTLTGAIDRMEKLNLVRRVKSPHDARSSLIEATAAASRKRAKIVELAASVEAQCFAALPAADRVVLRELLERITRSIEQAGEA